MRSSKFMKEQTTFALKQAEAWTAESIRINNGPEFISKTLDAWAYTAYTNLFSPAWKAYR